MGNSTKFLINLSILIVLTLVFCSIMVTSQETTSEVCDTCGDFGYCALPGANETCDKCSCPTNFNGSCCQDQPAPGCSPNPCPSGNYQCVQYEAGQYGCTCTSGWTGSNCETSVDPCTPDPCGVGADACYANGTGTVGWTCDCNWGFTGQRCENYSNCNGFTKKCVCNGTTCQNGGTCAYAGSGDYQCFCPENYDGPNCQYYDVCQNATTNPCLHGGVCTYTGNGTYTCACLDIWQGTNCTYYQACNPNPCENGGTCINAGNNFTCNCVHGYTDRVCGTIINNCDPNPCWWNGTCTNMIGDYNCTCPCGSYGKSCENRVNYCLDPSGNNYCTTKDSDAVCNNGFCEYSCTCGPDWTDFNCTMMMIVWNIIKDFQGAGVDLEQMLTDIVNNPTLIKDLVPFMLAQLPVENQTALSWDYDDLFVWASFERTELPQSDIVQWYQNTMGNCFTFNHDNSSKIFNLRYSGEDGGFKALMRVRQDEYLSWIDTASLLVFVHPRGETVMAESVRYKADQKVLTSYARLGKPYGVCVKNADQVASYYYSGNYSVDGCFRSCYQDAVQKACGCMDPRYPMSDTAIPCDLGKRNCVLNVTTVLGDPSTWKNCICPQPCNEEKYDVAWANTIFSEFPIQCMNKSNNTAYEQCVGYYEDMALISVSFPRLLHKTVVETPAMSFNDVITRLGSYLGLLCGVSICTLVEFGFLVYRIFMAFCTKRKFVHNKFDSDHRK